MELEYWRCYHCRRLLLSKHALKRYPECCEGCGSNRVTKSSPSGFFEHIKGLWWSLTVRA